MKLKGTIRRSDIEGGQWVLEVDGGDRFILSGALDGAKDGLRAEIQGKLDKNGMSFAMMGPLFHVAKLKLL